MEHQVRSGFVANLEGPWIMRQLGLLILPPWEATVRVWQRLEFWKNILSAGSSDNLVPCGSEKRPEEPGK